MKRFSKVLVLLVCALYVFASFSQTAFAFAFNDSNKPYLTVPENTIHVDEEKVVKIKVVAHIRDGSGWSWSDISAVSVWLIDCDSAGNIQASWTDYEEIYDSSNIGDQVDGSAMTTIFPYCANKGTHYLLARLSVEIGGGPSFDGGDAVMVDSVPIKVVVGEEETKATKSETKATKSETKTTKSETKATKATEPATTKASTAASTETSSVMTSEAFNPSSTGESIAANATVTTPAAVIESGVDILSGETSAKTVTESASGGITLSPLAVGIIAGVAVVIIGGFVVTVILLTKKK